MHSSKCKLMTCFEEPSEKFKALAYIYLKNWQFKYKKSLYDTIALVILVMNNDYNENVQPLDSV